jgi:hypothetical protein
MGNYRHGMYGTPTYKSWSEMKHRCDHSQGCYASVSYCDRWSDFDNFYLDMGDRPVGKTLDRIDPHGDYEPDNCRWADIITQENNRTNNVFYSIDGEKLTLTQIARKYQISRSNLANKIYILKWNMEDAVNYLVSRKGVRTYRRT